jgi:hypothetical protein
VIVEGLGECNVGEGGSGFGGCKTSCVSGACTTPVRIQAERHVARPQLEVALQLFHSLRIW